VGVALWHGASPHQRRGLGSGSGPRHVEANELQVLHDAFSGGFVFHHFVRQHGMGLWLAKRKAFENDGHCLDDAARMM
jgi:hypothetical protein